MLWQQAFLETRWRFLVGLILLAVSAAFVVMGYPQVMALAQSVTPVPDTSLGREIAETMALSKTYEGYVWSQWFRQNGAQLGSFFAAIIGTGGLLSQGTSARLFTSGPPLFPGFSAASVWMTLSTILPPTLRSDRPIALTTQTT